ILGADDSRRYRCLQSKRAANRQNPVANLYAIGIAQLRDRQLFVGVNLDHREVRFLVHPHDLGSVPRCVPIQLHLNLGGLLGTVRAVAFVPANPKPFVAETRPETNEPIRIPTSNVKATNADARIFRWRAQFNISLTCSPISPYSLNWPPCRCNCSRAILIESF